MSARRAYEGITTAITNSSLLCEIYERSSPSLAMPKIRPAHVPNDDVDKQAYLRGYINDKMIDGRCLLIILRG